MSIMHWAGAFKTTPWWEDILNVPGSIATVTDTSPSSAITAVSGFRIIDTQWAQVYRKTSSPTDWNNSFDWLIDATNYDTSDFEFMWTTVSGSSPNGGAPVGSWTSWTSPLTGRFWQNTQTGSGERTCVGDVSWREKGVTQNKYPTCRVTLESIVPD